MSDPSIIDSFGAIVSSVRDNLGLSALALLVVGVGWYSLFQGANERLKERTLTGGQWGSDAYFLDEDKKNFTGLKIMERVVENVCKDQ